MSTYKESYYNIKNFNGHKYAIFNTLNGRFIQFDNDISGHVFKQLQDPGVVHDKNIFEYMIKNGFIIKQDTCEETALESLKQNVINNHEQLNLIVFPTERCNFRCKYCYENFEKTAMSGHVQENLVEFVRANIKKYKKVNVDWFGGEPLLSMDVIEKISRELIKLCNENRVMYIAEITTNGYYLTPENLNRLKKCRVYRFQVTLDGLDETHDKQRVLAGGGKTWHVIMDNLKYIRDNLKSGLMQIVIRTNFTREIYNRYKEYLSVLKDEFGRDKRFGFLFRLASDWGNMRDEDIKKVFCGEEEYMDILTYSLENNFFNVGTRSCLVPGSLLCYAWKNNTITVRSDGIVGKCTLNLYDELNQISHIDNYNIDSHAGFWDAGERGTPEKCRKCKKYPVCLKINCNMATKAEIECEYDMKYLKDLLPYLCKPEYGCKLISGKDVIKDG